MGKRAAIATATAAGLALALAAQPERPAMRYSISLPRLEQRQPAPPAIRPDTADWLVEALRRPGVTIIPQPGRYMLRRQARVAQGVTLDGRGAVLIQGHGLLLEEADEVTLRGLSIVDVEGDAITVERSRGVLLERVELAGWVDGSDGLLDVVHGPSGVVVRDSLLRDHVKCSLIGHQRDAADHATVVLFERVHFLRCQDRMPKVHRATVTLRDVIIEDWRQDAIDAQLGALVLLERVTWIPGRKSHDRWITATGGEVREIR